MFFFALDDGRELRTRTFAGSAAFLLVPESRIGEFRDRLGADLLKSHWKNSRARFGSRRARVKALLLDQRVLSGVGNIYADESLFRARIHPARIASNLTQMQIATLHQSVRKILTAAIRLRAPRFRIMWIPTEPGRVPAPFIVSTNVMESPAFAAGKRSGA